MVQVNSVEIFYHKKIPAIRSINLAEGCSLKLEIRIPAPEGLKWIIHLRKNHRSIYSDHKSSTFSLIESLNT